MDDAVFEMNFKAVEFEWIESKEHPTPREPACTCCQVWWWRSGAEVWAV